MDFDNFVKELIHYEHVDLLAFEKEQDPYHPEQEIFVATVALWEDEQYRCPKCGRKCCGLGDGKP